MLRVMCVVLTVACAVMAPEAVAQAPMRVALVPLDDRPVCLQYPEMLAPLAHATVVTPPLATLGRFTTPGDPAAIGRWLASLDLTTVDALIVSIDMLAYGGLVASRVHQVDVQAALARLDVLQDIRRRRPDLPIYAFSVIMRLAPTADGTNEAWREPLARWAELSPDRSRDADTRREVDALERAIPASALDDYRAARARNRRVNHASLDLLDAGVLTHLVLSQDDAKPRGVHVADRASLLESIRTRGLAGRVAVQPGADEVAMLLLSRAVLAHHGLRPSMHAIYSSEAARTMVAPFEDRALHETVEAHIETAGAAVSAEADTTDLSVFVFASRHEPDVPVAFARRVHAAVTAGRRVVVADVDPKGDVQGASPAFTEVLLERGTVPRLYGYASWNTAGNTIGTAVPHGLLHHAGMMLAQRCRSAAWPDLAGAQMRVLLHRLVNDYAYQGVVRPVVNDARRAAGSSPLWLGDEAGVVARDVEGRLAEHLSRLSAAFTRGPHQMGSPARPLFDVHVTRVGSPSLTFPWARTFEARIDIDADVDVRELRPDRPRCEAAGR